MSDQNVSRRNFMVRAIVAVVAFLGVAVAVPLGGFGILPVIKRRETLWSDAGSLQGLGVNEPVERRFYQIVRTGWQEEKVERAVWVVKRPDGSITAFSPVCPHLGCGYRWFDAEKRFTCPCHASAFNINGTVLTGPAPRSLDTLDTKIEGGKIFVQYQAFLTGIPKKVAA